MLEGRERSEWARASAQMCLIATGFAGIGGKRKKFKPSDFDPFSQRAEGGKRMGAAEFGALMFGGMAKKAGKVKRETRKHERVAGDPDPVAAGGDGSDDGVRDEPG